MPICVVCFTLVHVVLGWESGAIFSLKRFMLLHTGSNILQAVVVGDEAIRVEQLSNAEVGKNSWACCVICMDLTFPSQ